MYAVIETGGKQYRVEKDDVVSVEKLKVEAGDSVVFDRVLLLSNGKETLIGKPYVEGAKVEAEVVENGKGPKVIIFKYKAKKDYRKKQGHRQPYTMVKINGIFGLEAEEPQAEAKPEEAAEPAEAEAAPEAAESAETAAE